MLPTVSISNKVIVGPESLGSSDPDTSRAFRQMGGRKARTRSFWHEFNQPPPLNLPDGALAPKPAVPSSLAKYFEHTFLILRLHPGVCKLVRSWDETRPVSRCQCFTSSIFSLPVITTLIILFLGDRNPCIEICVPLFAR